MREKMGNCYYCNHELHLKDDETRCDNCGRIIRYICNSCQNTFLIQKGKKKLKECKACGFFICPSCNACKSTCKKQTWANDLLGELEPFISIKDNIDLEAIKKIIEDFIIDVRFSKERLICEKRVPISYAKSKLKRCLTMLKGIGGKHKRDILDTSKFKERFEHIKNLPIDTIATINEIREEGSYGQEYREIFYLGVCAGFILPIELTRTINNQIIKYWAFKRIDGQKCQYFLENLKEVKMCPHCKKIFDICFKSNECPDCIFKKGKKKNQHFGLITKLSNIEICQCKRGFFN